MSNSVLKKAFVAIAASLAVGLSSAAPNETKPCVDTTKIVKNAFDKKLQQVRQIPDPLERAKAVNALINLEIPYQADQEEVRNSVRTSLDQGRGTDQDVMNMKFDALRNLGFNGTAVKQELKSLRKPAQCTAG